MYRDDLAATHARLEQLQRELGEAHSDKALDQQRIAMLTAQLAATQHALQRLGGMHIAQGPFILAPRGTTILVLGILSIVMCQVLGPIAWAMGNEELRRISIGQVDPMTRNSATAGRICGIVATVLLIISTVTIVGMVAFVGAAASSF